MSNDKQEPKIWEGTVLTIPNRHYECCGKPPELEASGCYTAYFENQYGEQIVFQYDYGMKQGKMWHGDWSWEHPLDVFAGIAPEIILSEEEREWLRLCWKTATEFEPEEVKLNSTLALARTLQAHYESLLAAKEIDDPSFKKTFERERRRWQKEEKAILDELEKLRAIKEAEDIIKDKGGGN